MAKVNIPKEYKDGFREFSLLTDEQREELVDTISKNPVKTSNEEMAGQVVKQLQIDSSVALAIVSSITSLSYVVESRKDSSDDILSGVVESLSGPEFDIDPNNLTSIGEALSSFFSMKSTYYITNKAQVLTFQRERLLVSSKVITDLRPIFGEDDDCEVKGEVVLQTLKIEYQEGYEVKALYMAMDNSDLSTLKAQIERAQQKEAVLRKSTGNLPNNFL